MALFLAASLRSSYGSRLATRKSHFQTFYCRPQWAASRQNLLLATALRFSLQLGKPPLRRCVVGASLRHI